MKKILLSLIVLGSIALQSCDKKEVPFHVEDRFIYINYEKDAKHLFSYSFVSSIKNEAYVSIPLRYSGNRLTQDAVYDVTVSYPDTGKELQKGTEYELPEKMVFRKGMFADTLKIKVKRTERMKTDAYSMKIELKSTDDFKATMRNMLDARIEVSDNASVQPDWWNRDVVQNYLGEFSPHKYRLFSKEIYAGDYGKLAEADKRYHAIRMKNYVEDNKITDEDTGLPMDIPVK